MNLSIFVLLFLIFVDCFPDYLIDCRRMRHALKVALNTARHPENNWCEPNCLTFDRNENGLILPFARGMHKKVFSGTFGNRSVVIKASMADVPSGNHSMDRQVVDWFRKRRKNLDKKTGRAMSTGEFAEHVRSDFVEQIREELSVAALWDPVNGGRRASPSVATFLGVCLNEDDNSGNNKNTANERKRADASLVVQEGPLIPLTIVQRHVWPLIARLQLALNLARMLALTTATMVPCTFNAHQIGVSQDLAVRWIDLGHIVEMPTDRHGARVPLYRNVTCKQHSDCVDGIYSQCLSGQLVPDRVCLRDKGVCHGIDSATLAFVACARFFNYLFDEKRGGVPELKSALLSCQSEDRDQRISLEQLATQIERQLDKQYELPGAADQLMATRAELNSLVERMKHVGAIQCAQELHCISFKQQ